MNKINLNGWWILKGADPNSYSIDKTFISPFGDGDELTVKVPGDINDALLKQNKIPDPYLDGQAIDSYWVSAKEWWYKLDFNVVNINDEHINLYFGGIDGSADIWLNDSYLGSTENAFRQYKFNVKNICIEVHNVLIIRLKSIDNLLGGPRLDNLGGWRGRRAYLRKPQFNFGWDWALPLPSMGISGDVWLETGDDSCFTDYSVQTYKTGRIDFTFEVNEKVKRNSYEIIVEISGHGVNLNRVIMPDTYKSYLTLEMPHPKLWYPNGYGEQPLYRYRIELCVNGKTTDVIDREFGIREVRINENPFTEEAGPGYSFWLEVNGEKIFCKGANWIPMEIWPGTINSNDYTFYLNKAKEANFNILRVWGGGIYENDEFYNLCDKMGIMVWQDFMFASTGYPVEQLRDEIIAEAYYQIHRLRNHSCIVIWCGCNEDVYSWSYIPDNYSEQQDTGVCSEDEQKWIVNRKKDDPQIYTMILRGMVNKYGLNVPYIESSPYSKDDYGNMPNSGNSHVSCWKYALFAERNTYSDFRKHFEQVCSFNSEFCIQGPCNINTFKKFFTKANLWPPNDVWIYHIQKGHRDIPHYEQTLFISEALFGKIGSLQNYIKFGQTTHLEMMRSEFESARRDYPNNGGTMVWMYNDCWPTANWSVIDYYKKPKPAYYAAKRACKPVLPIIFERKGKVEFLISNQTMRCVKVNVVYGLETLEGIINRSIEKLIEVPANSTTIFDTIDKSELNISNENFVYLYASINGKPTERATYFPNGWKDVKWPEPNIIFHISGQNKIFDKWRTHIQVTTEKYVRMCHLVYEDENNNHFFSDNYFDLPSRSSYSFFMESEEQINCNLLRLGHWLTVWE